MVELVGIESNIDKIEKIISRTSGHPNTVKTALGRKTSHWNHTEGHLLCPSRPLSRSAPSVVHDSDQHKRSVHLLLASYQCKRIQKLVSNELNKHDTCIAI